MPRKAVIFTGRTRPQKFHTLLKHRRAYFRDRTWLFDDDDDAAGWCCGDHPTSPSQNAPLSHQPKDIDAVHTAVMHGRTSWPPSMLDKTKRSDQSAERHPTEWQEETLDRPDQDSELVTLRPYTPLNYLPQSQS